MTTGTVVAHQIEDECANAHNRIYASLSHSPLFAQILAHAMGADYPLDSTQYSFVGMQGLRWVADRIRSAPAGTFLDVGCGDGSLARWLAKLSARPMLGSDISGKAIEIASRGKKPVDDCEFFVADFCAIPLKSGAVSAITALDCVQHAEPSILAAELARVCIPGGHFFFTHWMKLPAAQLAQSDPFCASLAAAGFSIADTIDLDPNLAVQFMVYAYVHANKAVLVRELGAELFSSLMYEAQHLYPLKGKVAHLGVWATRQ
jgi:SAM-dependent methyltransferase